MLVRQSRERGDDEALSARRHPTLTMAGLFAAGLVGVGMISYFKPGGRELYPSLVTGLGCGLALAWLGWRETHEDAAGVKRPVRRLTVFNVLSVGQGLRSSRGEPVSATGR
jgi:uncharacterized membrane protein (UPF0136 family)